MPIAGNNRYYPPIEERLLSRIFRDGFTACWHWGGTMMRLGYGMLSVSGKDRLAHRVSYETFVGPIPDGHDIDHVRARGCVSRDCINPDHLEPVTHAENIARGKTANRTECKNGHQYVVGNFVVEKQPNRPNGVFRKCLRCPEERNTRRRKERGNA